MPLHTRPKGKSQNNSDLTFKIENKDKRVEAAINNRSKFVASAAQKVPSNKLLREPRSPQTIVNMEQCR